MMLITMQSLQRRRAVDRVFAGKHSFITPRDLFRWAERIQHNWRGQGVAEETKQIAEHGFMLLAERLRTSEGKEAVREVLEHCCRVKINVHEMYSQESVDTMSQQLKQQSDSQRGEPQNDALQNVTVTWTTSMRRLFVLTGHCILNYEPVTTRWWATGCGKTTVCQLLSTVQQTPLHIINCHQHTEASDFLGGLRPLRKRQQSTEVLQQSMKTFVEQVWQATQATNQRSRKAGFVSRDAGTTQFPRLSCWESFTHAYSTLLSARNKVSVDEDVQMIEIAMTGRFRKKIYLSVDLQSLMSCLLHQQCLNGWMVLS